MPMSVCGVVRLSFVCPTKLSRYDIFYVRQSSIFLLARIVYQTAASETPNL